MFVIAGNRRQQGTRVLDDGLVRARWRTWPRQPSIAHVVMADHTIAPVSTTIRDWIALIAECGHSTIRTGALSTEAAVRFREHGFVEIQRLALLHLGLDGSRVPDPHHRLRPLRGDRAFAAAERIDERAFETEWNLDAAGIREACEATPAHRIRLALTANDEPAGYMITGRNGAAGFVQRLAVDPSHEGQGVATSLILDGLRWLRRHRVDDVLINTRLDNERALVLYRRLGFVDMNETLSVLELDLGDHSGAP